MVTVVTDHQGNGRDAKGWRKRSDVDVDVVGACVDKGEWHRILRDSFVERWIELRSVLIFVDPQCPIAVRMGPLAPDLKVGANQAIEFSFTYKRAMIK